VCGFREHLIPLSDVSPYHQSFIVFIELIEIIGHFLAAGLDGEIGLSEGDDFLAGVAILDDQIAGVS